MITVDTRTIREVERQLGQFSNKAPTVISRALNRAATNAKTNAAKKAREEYIIKASDIKNTITIKKATKNRLATDVISKGERLGLHKFKVSPKNPRPKRPPKSLKVGVKKSSSKELLHAFVADVNGAKVFERVSKSRLPIKQLYGLAVPQMIGHISVRDFIESESLRVFDQRLNHEVENILKGITK